MLIRCLLTVLLCTLSAKAEFKAGAFAQDISPTRFPTPVNGNMKGAFAQSINDPMNARCLALHDGKRALVYVVVDACMIPREICEDAKALASKETGIPAAHMLISATHTHSAGTLASVFQSDPDPEYIKTVAPRIAAGIAQAVKNMEPAEFGWAFGSDPTQVFNRRWHMKEGQYYENPFGITTDRAKMNPGNVSPTVSVPTAPVDQDVAVMAVRAASDKRPIGLLANYSLHYVGGNPAISADYYGVFAQEIGRRLGAADDRYQGKPAFVGILSNGTSGNINNINFGSSIRFKRNPGEQIKIVAGSVADAAFGAYEAIRWETSPTLDSEEADLPLGVRKANPQELAQAKEWMATIPKDKDGQWADRKAIYAREAVLLADYPDTVPVKLQAHRIGTLSVAAIPCEVFVQIGLHLKRTTPFVRHFTISLANGYNGYLPTEEDHAQGGYETWRARSSYLEVPASTKVVEKLETMLGNLKQRN
ncbi:MAG TPA: neutral/alkaline non-lysosomal ceramidase N-terminal domain-containing protein [Prosthecobacter sp.]